MPMPERSGVGDFFISELILYAIKGDPCRIAIMRVVSKALYFSIS